MEGETLSEHEQRRDEDEKVERDETIEDLDVPDEQSKDVGGGKVTMTDLLVSGHDG